MVRFISTSICAFLLITCASKPVEQVIPLQIEGLIMNNQTQMWVSAVRLLVPATGNFVSCGNIPPGSMCSTTFPETAYTGNQVEVTWSQGGQIHSTGLFILQLPVDLDDNKPAMVRVVISGPGTAGAAIFQR